MGCSESRTIDSLNPPETGFAALKDSFLQRLLNTETIKELSKSAFVSVLNKYPEAKKIFKVPETTKTDTELIDTKEVQAASDKFLNHYVDIAKTADSNLDATIEKKAAELNNLGVKAEYVKCYGQSLAENVAKDVNNQMTASEEKAWKTVTDQVTSKLTDALDKLPNSSSPSP